MDVLAINADGTTAIADGAFSGMEIECVVLNGVAKVGSSAFRNCQTLQSVAIPNAVTNIGDMAFRECADLGSMTFPASLASIGDRAFVLCSSLTNVTFEDASPEAAEQVFWSRDSVAGRSPTPDALRGFYARKYDAQWKAAMTDDGKWRNVSMTCLEPGVTVVYDKTMGKVTGGGEYPAGKTVTLKATANKGYVFAGWYADAGFRTPLSGSVDHRTPSYAYVVKEYRTPVYARFVLASDDRADVSFSLPTEFTNGVTAVSAPVVVSGCTSLPTVKVTGLPTGLKFTAKDILKKGSKTEVEVPANTIYGTATKSGVYTVVATVTTAGKQTASASSCRTPRRSSRARP